MRFLFNFFLAIKLNNLQKQFFLFGYITWIIAKKKLETEDFYNI